MFTYITRRGSAPMQAVRRAPSTLIALGLLMCPLISSAQAPPQRVYLKYHGQLASVEEGLQDVSCWFRFTASGQMNQVLYEEEQSLSLVGGRFSTTLGAQEQPLLAELFRDPLDLKVSCDLDQDGQADVSVTEPVGQSPVSAHAISALEAERVEASAVYLGESPLFGLDGSWRGPPIIPQHEGSPLIDSMGRWIGVVSAPSAHVDELTAGQVLADNLYAPLLGSQTSETVSHSLRELYLRPLDESSAAQLLINSQGVWLGELSASSGSVDSLEVTTLTLSTLHAEGGEPLINSQGRWVGPLPDGDRDSDGFPDIQELALGTDPLLASDQPLDQDLNGTPDVLEPLEPLEPQAHPLEGVVTQLLEISARTTTTLPDEASAQPWVAAQLEFSRLNGVTPESLEVNLSLSYLDAAGQPASPSTLKITLVKDGVELVLHDNADELVGRYPEEGRDPASWPIEATTIGGVWSLHVEDSSADARSLTVQVFKLSASYQIEGQVTLLQDLNLAGSQRLIGLPAPQADADAATKRYVDEHLTYPSQFTYRYKRFTPPSIALQTALGDERTRSLFAGQLIADWAGVTASQLDESTFDALLTGRGQAKDYVTLVSVQDISYASYTGVFIAQFEVENTTPDPIVWSLNLGSSCKPSHVSSLSLNGVDVWSSDSTCGNYQSQALSLTIPAAQVSTFTLLVRSNNEYALFAAIADGTLALPAGLRYRARWLQ